LKQQGYYALPWREHCAADTTGPHSRAVLSEEAVTMRPGELCAVDRADVALEGSKWLALAGAVLSEEAVTMRPPSRANTTSKGARS
jgi:hypothetical protein